MSKHPPHLPADDPHPDKRKKALADARDDYQFDFSYQEIVSAKKVPLREKTDPHYWWAIAKVTAALKVNELATRSPGEELEHLGEEFVDGLAKKIGGLMPDKVAKHLREHRDEHAHAAPEQTPATYDRMYATIDPPSTQKVWDDDDVFAWQALAGCNPIMIRKLTAPLDHFPVTEAHYAKAVSGDTLEAAMKEGRLYLADYAILEHVDPGVFEGKDKYVFAPLALYARTREGKFVAVAIQCSQRPDESPIFTPADGASWRMARCVVQSSDGNFQGIISHFAWCHEVMESVILATHRQLAPNHPIHVLLSPHFANTMITNDIAMTSLIGPDGNMERLQSGTLESSLDLAKRSLREFRLLESAPTKEFAARGVDDTDGLPFYPFRDDGLESWGPLKQWVHDYLRLYYADDAAVAGDVEVQAWVDELGSQEGGRLEGLSRPQTFDALWDLLAQIVFRCTVFHAGFNYTSYDFFGYVPNLQAAAFGPAPTGGEGDSEEALHAMWPPYQAAYEGMHLFYTIFCVQLNRVGHYPDGHFVDERVAPLEKALRDALDEAEARIEARDKTRLVPYPYLRPSKVSNSIHV